jgi:hypothetical protein
MTRYRYEDRRDAAINVSPQLPGAAGFGRRRFFRGEQAKA